MSQLTWLLVVLVLAGAPIVVAYFRPVPPARRARYLRRSAMVVAFGVTILGGLFIAGETFDDPGGWPAVAAMAGGLVPLIALALLAWYRPALAVPTLAVLTAALVALNAWMVVVGPRTWRTWEDNLGPLRAIDAFVLLLPLALLGWRRALAAGLMLLVAAVAPVVALLLVNPEAGAAVGGSSTGAVATPMLALAVLLLTAAAEAGRNGGGSRRGGQGERDGRQSADAGPLADQARSSQ
ncbi:MAG TPA: hypothetical protein VF163_07395 [Micromonosporaceae bacterium]